MRENVKDHTNYTHLRLMESPDGEFQMLCRTLVYRCIFLMQIV